jgi:hypothetical protein
MRVVQRNQFSQRNQRRVEDAGRCSRRPHSLRESNPFLAPPPSPLYAKRIRENRGRLLLSRLAPPVEKRLLI